MSLDDEPTWSSNSPLTFAHACLSTSQIEKLRSLSGR